MEHADYDRLLADPELNSSSSGSNLNFRHSINSNSKLNPSGKMGNIRDWPRKRRSFQFALIGIFATVIFLLLSSHLWNASEKGIDGNGLESAQFVSKNNLRRGNYLPALSVPELSPIEYRRLCYPSLPHNFSISHVVEKFKLMATSKVAECVEIAEIFSHIYQITKIKGQVVLPEQFVPQVKGWLNNDEKLFSNIGTQDIFKVTNKVFGESSVFNMLRSKRPVSKPSMDPMEYVEQLASSTEATCDFCNFQQHTAQDVFGRITNRYSASASNTFKIAKFHGLFFPLKHHPLNISYEALNDLFLNTAGQWIQKAFQTDSSQAYVTLLFDTLPHAGASQVHPHVHGLTDSRQYAGIFNSLRDGTWAYYDEFKRFLWSDILLVHWALGMVVTEGNAFAIIPITARKDHEFMILADSMNVDSIKLLYRILQAYRNQLGTFCFSSSAALPVLGAPHAGLPFVYRIGSRGDCTSLRSDVSSLELYSINNINSDLAKTLQALQSTKMES